MILKDTVSIITGSSSGIGAAVARSFAAQGGNVVINYAHNDEGAKKVAADCEALGAQTLVVKGNVAEDSECRAIVDATLEKFGTINILINNAGTTKFCDHRDLDGLSKDDFLNIYSVNTIGAYQMIRATAPALSKQPVAHVINVASMAAITGGGSSIAYAASKGALVTMTMSLARVMGPEIRVNAICPGFVQGEWLQRGWGQERYDKFLQNHIEIAPLKAIATPEAIAQTITGFISGGDLTTGETLIIDGGVHLHTAPLRR